jgi:hypothetical protein
METTTHEEVYVMTQLNPKRREEKKEFTVVAPHEDSKPTAPPSVRSTKAPAPSAVPTTFDGWWIQTQNKYNFKPALKKAVKKHFEARGFTDHRRFNEGLRDFGFNT